MKATILNSGKTDAVIANERWDKLVSAATNADTTVEDVIFYAVRVEVV
jgi:hypothetical protein